MLSQNQVLNQGRYRIIHSMGNPDSASFYEAYDTVSDAKVVVRERSGGLASNITPGQMETLKITFAEQAKRLTDMKHDVLLGVRDFFSETGRQYLVLEPFDGQDLGEFIGIDTKPAMTDVLRWADQLLDALDYLHSRNPAIIHQNINPHNVRLTSEFKIKLLLTDTEGMEEGESSDHTDNSINYKALEQLWLGLDYASQKVISNSLDETSEEILRQPADQRTDLYGLAASIYHVLTRTSPADPITRIIDILDGNEDPLSPLHVVNPDIPIAVSEFLMKALEIKRENRFSSAREMGDALKAVSAVLPVQKVVRPVEFGQAVQASLEPEAKRSPQEQLPVETKRQAQAKEPAAKEYKPNPARDAKPTANASGLSPLDEIKRELASDDLLDLPEPAQVAPVPVQVPDVLSLEAKPIVVDNTFGSILEADNKKSGFMSPTIMAVGAIAVLAIAVLGGWLMLGSSSKPTPAATVSTPPAQTSSATAPVEPASLANTAVINETVTVSAQAAKMETDKKAEAAKAKKTANAETKPSPTDKKKVTVDDLINDN